MTEQKKSFDDLDAVKALAEALEKFNDEERKRIIRWACERLGTDYATSEIKNKPSEFQIVNEQNSTKEEISGRVADIKTFVDNKNPKSDKHFAAVVAYYYKFEASGKKESITKNDLVNATRLADWNRLPRADQTLVNAANSGLLDKAVGSRGHYHLNSVGENLVAMVLPDKEKKKTVRKKKILKKKKVVKKKTKKK